MNNSSGKIVVSGGLMITLMLGVTYTWSVFAGPLVEKHGWSQKEVQLAFSFMLAIFSLSMIPAGLFQDKKGPKLSALFGGLLLGAGFITTALYAKSPLTLLITYSLFSGAGVGFAYGAPLYAAVKWYPSRKGLISGIIMFGFGFGSLLLAPIATKIILSQGNSDSFMILGLIIMLVVCFGAMLLKNPPNFSAAIAKNSEGEIGPKRMLKTAQFWLLWIIFACASSAGLMVIGNLATYTKLISTSTHGMPKEEASWIAAFAVGIMAVFNGLGRIFAGLASDKIGRDKVMLILFGLQSILLLTLSQASRNSSYLMLVWIALIGFCFGSCFSIMPSATADFFGTKNIGANYGVMFSAYGFGGILGPQIMAFMLDRARNAEGSILAGDYFNPFVLASVLVSTAALLSFFLKKKRNPLQVGM